MRRFYLFQRKTSPNFYVQIINPLTGEKMPAKSTGCTDKDEALFTVMSWLKDGVLPSGDNHENRKAEEVFSVDDILFRLRNAPLTADDTDRIIEILKTRGLITGEHVSTGNSRPLIDFLTMFWTWDTSPYIAEKQAYKQTIGHNHVDDMLRRVKLYWKPYFNSVNPNLSLDSLTRDMLRDFSIWTSVQHKKTRDKQKKELDEVISPRTCNIILKAGTTALNWAFNNGVIKSNPAAGLRKFGIETKKRGILSDKELNKLLTSGEWGNNEGAMLAAKLASQTGLRIGEIVALKIGDIASDRIHVIHSYSKVDGLKTPKNGEIRQIPILPVTRKLIIDYAKTNPHGYHPENYVFFQVDNRETPMRSETISNRFRGAVDSVIGEEERKSRNIVFHGLRHYYIKKMSLALDKRTMMLSGHKSESMLEHYANHADEDDFKKAAKATAEVFGRVFNFPQKEAQ